MVNGLLKPGGVKKKTLMRLMLVVGIYMLTREDIEELQGSKIGLGGF